MSQNALHAIIAMAPPSGQQGQSGSSPLAFVPLILMFVVFYFIIIRPQQKKAKEHTQLLKTLKVGDKVQISGGIIATVANVKDEKTVTVRSADSKLEVLKSAVTEIVERGGSDSKES